MSDTFELGPLQTKWLEALESGEYQQCCEVLHDNSGDLHCCLGVADRALGLMETCETRLAETFYQLGLRSDDGEFTGEPIGGCACLTSLNDDACLSFPEIAALIRSRPQDFFTESK